MALKKRGISEVVATMLLVLLAVLGVTIIAGFVVPYIKDNLKSTGCFKARDYYKFENSFGFNCYEESIDRYLITIRARGENSTSEKIKGFNLRFLSDDNLQSMVLEIKEGVAPAGVVMMGGGNLVVPLAGGKYSVMSYNYSSTVKYDKVEVYPLMDKICDMSDSIKLPKCS